MGKMQKEAESQKQLEDTSKPGCRELGEQARRGTESCHGAK